MAHFALLDSNNIVVTVLVGRDEDNEVDLSARTGQTYKRTSYNTHGGYHTLGGTPYRKNFAGVGYKYDQQRDAFIPPKPFQSWVLDEDTCQWVAPVIRPEDGEINHLWDENTKSWTSITNTLSSNSTPVGM